MESPYRTTSYKQSSKLVIVEPENSEVAFIMGAGAKSQVSYLMNPHILTNPTPTEEELRKETPAIFREQYGTREAPKTGFYAEVNRRIQLKTSDPKFIRAGMLTVNYPSGRDEPPNHCIFFREFEEDDGTFSVYIYDPNDEIGRSPVLYRQAFTTTPDARRKLRGARFIHPLADLRDHSLNHGYGGGVCQAISYSLSRLWGKIEEQMRTAAIPRRAGDSRSVVSEARFQRTRNKFDELLASPNITAKVLIRAALGATYEDMKDVLYGVSEPPKMRSAYAKLRAIAEGKKDEDDVEYDEL